MITMTEKEATELRWLFVKSCLGIGMIAFVLGLIAGRAFE